MSTIEKALEKLRKQSGESETTTDAPPVPESIGGETEAGPVNIGSQNVEPSTPASEKSRVSTTSGGSRRLDIDLNRLTKAGFLTPESGRSQLAEEMRHIKRPLVVNAFSRDEENPFPNLIMITSSRPSEGKTYTSLNLAMSVAKERDKTVLLVDADVAKPGVTRVLGVEKEKGLVDYLLDDSLAVSDVMLKTNVPNLRFLPAGKRHIHSTELLSSDNMRQFIQELSTRYSDRIVIFDSPPLLATSEASVLTELVGQIVVVVEAEKTSKQEVDEALSQIAEGKSVGLVLNKARGSYNTDYYGYYGPYGEE